MLEPSFRPWKGCPFLQQPLPHPQPSTNLGRERALGKQRSSRTSPRDSRPLFVMKTPLSAAWSGGDPTFSAHTEQPPLKHFLCQLIEETASHREPKLSRTSTAKTRETPSACELLSSLSTSFTSKTQTSQTEFAQIPLTRLWMQGLQCSAVRRSRHSASLPITPGVYT